jgi:type I restriction enzyme S subunit
MNLANDAYCIGRGVAAIRGRDGVATTPFLERILSGFAVEILEEAKGNGSTFPSVTGDRLRKKAFLLPPMLEQLRIAEVLSTLDETIEQTGVLIAKYQQIKTGLMNDLFTRGVTPDGRLRPNRLHAPHLYKESPLGWIPMEWRSCLLQDCIGASRPIVYGILMPGLSVAGGVPVVKVKDIVDGEIQTGDLLLTSPSIDAEYQRSRLRAGDILLTIRGTVGRIASVPGVLDGANITQDTARIGIVSGEPEFFRYYLESAGVRAYLAVNTLGVAVQGINLRDVRLIPVPLPPPDEQRAIVARLTAITDAISTESQSVRKFRHQKLGLMHDLLTGRVRVSVTDSEGVPA